MLCCCGNASGQVIALQSLHIGAAHCGTQGGVAAIGFVDTSPAQILCHIQNRREGVKNAHGTHLFADGVRHVLHQCRVKGGTKSDGIGVQHGVGNHRPAQGFAVEQCRNMMRGMLHDILLQLPEANGK